MELFLKAIESSNGFDDSDDDLDITQSEPALSFISRPPQWCIVDKWFTMQINCTDNNLTELEALVYNSEGHIMQDVLQPEHTVDKESRRVIVTIDPARKATFRLRFVNGSKGAWLHIGIHNSKNPEKCLLKSPPIKVQTNRSKRPRDNRRKPTPIVSSLSPSSVPSTGNFPGRKDRMLLIFGSNFYLWGNSPIIHLKRPDSREAIEIRPPNLIWWSDSLLECQLPECHQDLEVKVANYDMVFGDGRTLKVIPTQEPDSKQVIKPIQPISTTTTSTVAAAVRDNNHFNIEYSPGEGVEDVTPKAKVVLYLNNSFDQIPVMTSEKTENVNYKALTAVLRVYNKETEEKLIEVSRPADSVSQNSVVFDFSFVIPPQRLKDSSEPLFIAAYLRKENQFLIDPKSSKPLMSEKPLFANLMEEDDEDSTPESQPAVSPVVTTPKPVTHQEEVSNNHSSLLSMIRKCDTLQKLNDWETVLADTLREVREQKLRFLPKPTAIVANSALSTSNHSILRTSSAPSITSVELKPQPKKIDLRESMDVDDEDDEPISKRGKVAVNESKTEVSLPTPDPKAKNGIVYWKFFNPGNRTFLELTDGKLQIIGSRRIQMLIESVPANSKFVSAHLYVQKNDNFEVIENCARCKENGIPNVFCVLPRRGREHDFPWITFRITCTSTAKHWKGSLFWIGAEFLIDPTQGTIMKVFSPPIHVQSKVKGKDLVSSSSSSIERVGSRDSMRLDTPSPSPTSSNTPGTPLSLRHSGSVPNTSASPNLVNSTSPTPSASPVTNTQSTQNLVQPQVQPQIQLQALAAAAQQATISTTPTKSPTANNAPIPASPTTPIVSNGTTSPVSSTTSNSSTISALLSSMMANPVLKESGQPIAAPVKT